MDGSSSMAQKTALIVYAHQSSASFNAAARDASVQELKNQGFKVIVSDLYEMNFRASATQDDIIGDLKKPEHFQYGDETMLAWKEGRLSEDIVAEQRKVEEAELIIFQFPLWWFSVPGIMKGWIDRVLTQGFAFTLQKMYDNGGFKGKKAMLSFTTGATQTMFQPDGLNGDVNVVLWPLQNGVLRFCGFQVLAPQIFWAPAHSPLEVRTAMLEGWRARLKGLLAEEPLTFVPTQMFDLSFKGGFKLWPKVKEDQESEPYGFTTGHHLGKRLPPDNQLKAQATKQK
ncbi:NAD(P)H dehydrogenase [quinone] 1 [Betta splendens]|uniref:Ribosyldihydronicotinamide dehydrogenase [quinone] n=1 Tax=Betta splendens TaxID=158456 RepID=A0A6P7M2N5_BETSP|nr:NAD(P)H dehydrogenase [quinone] 1 [Betta splendens]XP_029000811.1 NAD(P)H dehydrogenase [quinone] 1 [Betta splendens]XP_029000812.1 NAD(P)H dehydrogenase [quinone] 1 [Betta splendens]